MTGRVAAEDAGGIAAEDVAGDLSGPDDRWRAIGVPLHDRGGLARRTIVTTVVDRVVHAGYDAWVDLVKERRRGFAGDIGRRGDDGFTESFDEMTAKKIVDQSNGHGAIVGDEIGGETDGAGIDDGRWFGNGVQVIEDP